VVTCEDEPDSKKGMIMDFKDLKKIVNEQVISKLDHDNLNKFIENPTCENILIWIEEQLKDSLANLKKLTLYESENSFCELNVNFK